MQCGLDAVQLTIIPPGKYLLLCTRFVDKRITS